MQAMFSLLLRFCPRKSAGMPNASAPAARELVLMNSRRSIGESEVVSGVFIESDSLDGFVSPVQHKLAGEPVSKITVVRLFPFAAFRSFSMDNETQGASIAVAPLSILPGLISVALRSTGRAMLSQLTGDIWIEDDNKDVFAQPTLFYCCPHRSSAFYNS